MTKKSTKEKERAIPGKTIAELSKEGKCDKFENLRDYEKHEDFYDQHNEELEGKLKEKEPPG